MKLSKKSKKQMIDSAITGRFKKQYDEALKQLTFDARELAVQASHHDSLVGKLSVEELKYCHGISHVYLRTRIETHGLWFIGYDYLRNVRCDVVYGINTFTINDSFQPLREFRALVKLIVTETEALTSVVRSYTKSQDLFEALPWLKKYQPEQPPKNTGLINKELIEQINANFGRQ
jgi:hypothetical protein